MHRFLILFVSLLTLLPCHAESDVRLQIGFISHGLEGWDVSLFSSAGHSVLSIHRATDAKRPIHVPLADDIASQAISDGVAALYEFRISGMHSAVTESSSDRIRLTVLNGSESLELQFPAREERGRYEKLDALLMKISALIPDEYFQYRFPKRSNQSSTAQRP